MEIPGLTEKTIIPVSLSVILIFAGFVWWMSAMYAKVQTIDQLNARIANLEISKEETQQTLVGLKTDVSYIRVSIDDLKKALADRGLPRS